MQRVVWFGVGSLVISAAAVGATRLAHCDAAHAPAVTAPVVAPPVAKPAPIAKPELREMLKVLGARLQRENTATYPSVGVAESYPAYADPDLLPPGKLFAVGPCERPDEKEREAIIKRVSASVNAGVWLRFGCKDRNGIVVDATFDTERKRNDGYTDHEGHWKILRVTDTKIPTLETLTGPSEQDWMEWANEQTLSTWALVDLDGDGIHDIIFARTTHEGGSSVTALEVDLRRSSDNKIVKLGSFSDLRDFGFARGSTAPLVLRTSTWDGGDPVVPAEYRCITATGPAECPAAAEAARIDRVAEIATWFVDGHTYAPSFTPIPDRDQLAMLLDITSVTGDERARLLAAAEETPASYRVKSEIDAKLAARAALPDTRPARLAALLGDTECTKCAYKVVTSTTMLPRQREQRTDRLVYNGVQLASVTVRGPSFTCSACGFGPPEQQFVMTTYRHGTSTVALVYKPVIEDGSLYDLQKRASTLTEGTLYVFVDGKQVEQHVSGSAYPWYAFDGAVQTTDLGAIGDTVVHWPAVPAAATQFLADEAARAEAQHRLESFNVGLWSNASYRAEVDHDRALVGI